MSNILNTNEYKVAKLLCLKGNSQSEIAIELGYTLRHTQRIIQNLKIFCNARNLAHLGFLASKHIEEQEKAKEEFKENNSSKDKKNRK